MVSLYKNYKRRVILGIMFLLLVILLAVIAVTYTMIRRAMEQQFGLGARATAIAVSYMIADDLDRYREFLVTRDVTSDYYRYMQHRLGRIKEQNNIKFIYTANRLDDTRTEYILDAEPMGSELYSAPGDPEDANIITLEVFNTKQPIILPPTVSTFGVLLGCSAPIIDEKGDVVGVVGVEFDIGTVFHTLKNWFVVLLVMCVFLFGFIGFLLSKVSGFFLEPIFKDKLTGAYSKRFSETLFKQSVASAAKSNQDLSVMMLDLDHFKKVNDTYGHTFGDVVLTKTSNIIQSCLRKEDFLIRYGGEEFLVLLFNIGSDIAMNVAERVRKKIEVSEIYNEKENAGIKVTISIGVATLRGEGMSNLNLIENADKALYKAKETRNASALYAKENS